MVGGEEPLRLSIKIGKENAMWGIFLANFDSHFARFTFIRTADGNGVLVHDAWKT